MLDKPAIPDDLIKSALLENYGILVKTLEFLPLGLDTLAGVYRVTSEVGPTYFLKLKLGQLYESSAFVPRFLADRSVSAVVAPIPTRGNKLWFEIAGWTGLLYPFIEGISSWEPGLSETEWQATGRAVRQIHSVTLPPELAEEIRREKFQPEEYTGWMVNFEKDPANFPGKSEAERVITDCWTANRETIHKLLILMENLAARLRDQHESLVICHADLHPGNMIRTAQNEVFFIDWDDVMLAPKERDFIFAGLDWAGADPTAVPFFEGYGNTALDWSFDWAALTYYLAERVVTDLLVCTRDTFFTPNLSEEAREESARLFCSVLDEHGEVAGVFAAARWSNLAS
ncbi:MAG: aminoglycoside phosphotransferase family protein [Chloroflexi bacterium]|nr:aminoglycoside phosphotransferase family protein [Chloroflexota bacterium]OJW06269.1 MAG: hypothetical protein BGO39_25890 [Chloroflexi bacterium 54-19]